MKRDFLYIVDPLSGSFATFDGFFKRLLAFGGNLSRNLGQVSNADQVVDGQGHRRAENDDRRDPSFSFFSSPQGQPTIQK